MFFYLKRKSGFIANQTQFFTKGRDIEKHSQQSVGHNEQNPYCIATYNAILVPKIENVKQFEQEK